MRELRRALHHLHDPTELRRSRLIDLFGLSQKAYPPSALRHLLSEAIERLKPGDEAPLQSVELRTYNILFYRFVEQSMQREVATDLGLSIRHLRRAETQAIQALADYLWRRYTLSRTWPEYEHRQTPSHKETPAVDSQTPSPEQELRWLQASAPSEAVAVADLIQTALRLMSGLASALGVQIACHMQSDLPPLVANATTVRHALVSLLSVALACARSGRIVVEATARGRDVAITIKTEHGQAVDLAERERERLDMAAQLVHLSGGTLDVSSSGPFFAATVALPAAGRVPVLIIEDNADTLRLLERYLANTRYRYVGTSDPSQALTLAREVSPQIIVLDVMLPGIDGWELLGRLHEHPALRSVPILVCSILPEENLAAALGAAGFLRKPITRAALLEALDRQLAQLPTESR